jgi:hypothetical protein
MCFEDFLGRMILTFCRLHLYFSVFITVFLVTKHGQFLD